jgi:hypothetical protein
MEANHSQSKKLFNGSLIVIERGQLVFGLDAFSAKSGVSIAKLRRYLKMLENDSMIDRQKTSKYSIITITCFDEYQSIDKQTTGKAQADNSQTTSKQQHYKNVKKEKNGKNEKNTTVYDFSTWPQEPDQETFNAWIAAKKKAKGSVTQTAINTVGKEISKAVMNGVSVNECLEAAENGCWKGFKAEWVTAAKASGPAGRQVRTMDDFNRDNAAQAARVRASGILDDIK